MKTPDLRRSLILGGLGLLALVVIAAFVWRDDILRTSLDPKQPFQVYEPPAAPDYGLPSAWTHLPAASEMGDGARADVFFIHPTTFNGGPHWNAPIDDRASQAQLEQVMLPNYAGPFQTVGRVFAPKYRQASLYAYLTQREDARDARRFAYGDVERAFRLYLARYGAERPFLVVGVEQGGFLADRLLRQVVAADPALRRRLVGAYLIRTVVAADDYGPDSALPACRRRAQAGCVMAYAVMPETGGDLAREFLGRALVWGRDWDLDTLHGRPALCVNPLLGAQTLEDASASANLGAADATNLEWGLRPAFLPRQVSARCGSGGLLHVSRPKSQSLQPRGPWADRLKAPGYNLVFADLEADAMARLAAWRAQGGRYR